MKSTVWNGKPITEPGVYSDINLDDYHSGPICVAPSISSTGLRRLYSQSPAHYFDMSPYNPSPAEDDEPDHFILGRAAHHLLLGAPGHFSKDYVIRPDSAPDGRPWHGSNKTCIAWLESMRANKKTVLKPDQIADIKGMAISLGKHPLVVGGILDGWIERSLFWQDKETGVWLKVRPDAIPKDGQDAADLKTTNSVQWLDLMKTIENFGYCQQAALVREGFKAVLDLDLKEFVLIFVEKKRPYCVEVTPIDADDIARGMMMNRIAIRKFAECMEKGDWPGPGNHDIRTLRLSDNARHRIDERLRHEGILA